MAGRLNKRPYPNDSMTDVFHVTPVGATLVLTQADPELITIENAPPGQTEQPERPSMAGDVLSRTPEGDWIARPEGTAGTWETNVANGSIRVYNSAGVGGKAEGFVYWNVPNE